MKKLLSLLLFVNILIFASSSHTLNEDSATNSSSDISDNDINKQSVFESINFGINVPSKKMFDLAYAGYTKLKEQGKIKKEILSIVDFEQSSNNKRLWIIDLKNKKVLFNTLVAHGRNSGNEFATSFSNVNSSYKSSLGFYITGGTYTGKHGNSLKLYGVEKNINDAAYERAIVIHGADYVSSKFAQAYGRIGRSLGCPAVPVELADDIIADIANGSCLFLYKNDTKYLSASQYVDSKNNPLATNY